MALLGLVGCRPTRQLSAVKRPFSEDGRRDKFCKKPLQHRHKSRVAKVLSFDRAPGLRGIIASRSLQPRHCLQRDRGVANDAMINAPRYLPLSSKNHLLPDFYSG